MDQIISEVVEVVSGWKDLVEEIGIARSEVLLMRGAFRVKF
ncbi:MAG: hypothetical protein ABFR62_13690 [Bacteroidota bacterium]